VRVSIRVTPKSRRAGIQGLADRPAGGADLKVALQAAPEKGRANDELIRLLAQAWGIPRRRLTLLAGAADRHKTVLVEGDPGLIMSGLEAWLEAGLEAQPRSRQ
jgi:uncharacterized protein